MNMRKKFTISLVVSLLFLFGISDYVVGQVGVLSPEYLRNRGIRPDVNLRRVDADGTNPDYIGWTDSIGSVLGNDPRYNVGLAQFGAGESVMIQGQQILIPNQNHLNFGQNASLINIGSTNAQNIVMNNYNAGGKATGFLYMYGSSVQNFGGGNFNIDSYNTTWGPRFSDLTPSTFPAPTTSTIGTNTATGLLGSVTNPLEEGTRPSGFVLSQYDGNLQYTGRIPGTAPAVLWGAPTGGRQAEIYYSYFSSLALGGPGLYGFAGALWSWVDLVQVSAPAYKDYISHIYLSNHVGPTASNYTTTYTNHLVHWGVKSTEKGGLPYTTTAGLGASTLDYDNGIDLVGAVGEEALKITADIGTAQIPGPGERYIRPTTVVANGTNTFESIEFNELRWYMYAYNLERFSDGNWYKKTSYPHSTYRLPAPFSARNLWDVLRGGCSHIAADGTGTTQMATREANFKIDLYEIGEWVKTPNIGPNKLDAAVQLLNGARVCITGSVTDNTGAIAGKSSVDRAAGTPDQQTNALIVLPSDDRATLRTGGNFKANMTHDRANDLSQPVYYLYSLFPDPAKNIYMYEGTTIEYFARPGNLGGFRNINSYITTHVIDVPPTSTNTTVFGVFGDYDFDGLMAEIHTTANHDATDPFDPIGGDDNQGVIEVGPTTGGKEHFHIYSGGILKNYEGCTALSNFTMQFGNPTEVGYEVGGMPNLYLDGEKPLHILNYGNNSADGCDANIWFWGGAQFAFTDAFANATNYGPMQVQALSDVEFRVDMEIDATASEMGNNLYILSDAGNIVTQKFDITSDYWSPLGQGLITFWAESRRPGTPPNVMNFPDECANADANRNGRRGNIFLNDAFTITRTGDSQAITETNFIAENNIRTAMFDFVSNNTFNDTTNIISRKGDIYLGFSAHATVYDNVTGEEITTGNGYNDNVFRYTIKEPTNNGVLNLKAGWDDRQNLIQPMGGGNVYFTKLNINLAQDGRYSTIIDIPFSREYECTTDNPLSRRANIDGSSMTNYENHGIIGGAGRCGTYYGTYWNDYAGQLISNSDVSSSVDTTLIYIGNNGNLIADAGESGNIIINRGSYLNFQSKDGFAYFRTRKGDIDLRGMTDVERLNSSVLILADNGNPNKESIACGCDEQMNNIYIQDMLYKMNTGNGNIFIGADNNIKLQYGGLKDRGTWKDPFRSQNAGYSLNAQGRAQCGGFFHCDSDPTENKARPLHLDFSNNDNGGGVALVASDLIDIYKEMIYTGGLAGKGMSAVPYGDGRLHGESVAGYGLYIKSQGNKPNWKDNPFELLDVCTPLCPIDTCGKAYLHQVARVTFHDDALLFPEKSKAYIGSPVLEVFGKTVLNTNQNWGANSLLHIQADSLIFHDDLTIEGSQLQLATWSNLDRNMPVIKFGHQRFTPPYSEDGTYCEPCRLHRKSVKGLDTIFVAFKESANVERLHTLVADHTVLSFLTDSFDNRKGNPVLDARFYTDIFKVRNQVELWSNPSHIYSGHIELISETQMFSKDYSGIFTRHLHMEPISPDCKNSKNSELWIPFPTLEVITTSTFGGFGTLHADVHVETHAAIAPGYSSLGIRGNCYEQKSGILRMNELRMDGGAELHFSIGNIKGFDGWETDAIDVDNLVAYGSINIFVEKRCNQQYAPGCYPIIFYNTVGKDHLNNLKLATLKIDNYPLALDFSTPGVVFLCVGEPVIPIIQREVVVPTPPPGVTIKPTPGVYWVPWGRSFTFTLNFSGTTPYMVTLQRPIDPRTGTDTEILVGVLNANGEYEYTIPIIKTQPVYIYIGPERIATSNEAVERNGVWSFGNTLYINVNKEDIASIYSVTGTLVQRIEVPAGGASVPMQRGAFIVTLKDGSVHKVIIR